MQLLGHVCEIWRYPVKSMGGERMPGTLLTTLGVPGDRCWAVIDADKREIRSAKKWPQLMQYHARHLPDTTVPPDCYDDAVPDVIIETPAGEMLHARDPATATLLADALGKRLWLSPRAHPSNRDHYRLAGSRTREEFAEEMALQSDEKPPDFSGVSVDVMAQLAEFATPPGAYHDAFPVHLLTTDSLAFLAQHTDCDLAIQRFRPNLLIESRGSAVLTENGWIGSRLQLGGVVLRVDSRTIRCAMPGRPQDWCGVREHRGIVRSMVEHCDRGFGVNIVIEKPGFVGEGDPLFLLEPT